MTVSEKSAMGSEGVSTMEVNSPVTGTVWKIEIGAGGRVQEGDVIMILESMKMEIPVEAEAAGIVQSLAVEPGVAVDEGQTLCVIES